MDGDRRDLVTAHLNEFACLVGDPSAQPPLDETALTLAAVLRPGLDVIEWLTVLDELAASCPTPTRDGVVAHLCKDLEFRGDRATYGDWRHSCLDVVLTRRRGIPITLSVVVVEVARRVGVELCGVGMPAHFLVGDPSDPDWFADPFDTGTVLRRSDARALLEHLGRGQIRWQESFLDPTPNRAIIARMTNNLSAGFTQRGDRLRLALVARMRSAMAEFESEQGVARLSQAVLN